MKFNMSITMVIITCIVATFVITMTSVISSRKLFNCSIIDSIRNIE